MKATSVEAADVLVDDTAAGRLERTRTGSRFSYAPDFLAACRERGWGLGFRVPLQPVVETRGVNLHSFLAGLLPEGLRLHALERSVKTSPDDLLSLLLAAGSEAVGDVRVVAEGAGGEVPPPTVDLGKLDRLSFSEVLERSLDYRRGGERRLLPGVQEKVSASRVSLPVRARPGTARAECILKLEPSSLPNLVANEAFFMAMARGCGVETADVEVVRDRDGAPGLLVTRFDRRPGHVPLRLHVEDGCQLLDRYPADKYRVSFREMASQVVALATSPAVEGVKLLRLLAFSYLIGNGDLHARNVSLLVQPSGRVVLAPAYDLLSTLPYGDRRMALKVAGRDDNLKRAHLLELARQLGVPLKPVESALDEVVDASGPFVPRLGELGFPARKVADLARLVQKRRAELGGVSAPA